MKLAARMSKEGTSWVISIVLASGLIPAITALREGTKKSFSPKSVSRAMNHVFISRSANQGKGGKESNEDEPGVGTPGGRSQSNRMATPFRASGTATLTASTAAPAAAQGRGPACLKAPPQT